MNYYDELGLQRTATQEQVRRAYRTACLLIHPDRQTDPEVERIAELQMQRLNEVYDTLVNPEKRRRYDLTLDYRLAKHTGIRFDWRVWATQLSWYSGAALCVAIISWHTAGERIKATQSPAPAPPAEEPAAGALRAAARLSSNAQPLKRASVSRPLLLSLPDTPATTAAIPHGPQIHAIERLIPTPDPPTDTPAPAAPATQTARLEGTWFYSHPAARPSTARNNFYAPQFIEAIIQESGSNVRGRYSARYEVPDQAISPEVTFRFEGRIDDDEALLTWSGKGGAAGEARITIIAENRIELRWSANQLGQQLGLSEGRAILVRARPR